MRFKIKKTINIKKIKNPRNKKCLNSLIKFQISKFKNNFGSSLNYLNIKDLIIKSVKASLGFSSKKVILRSKTNIWTT